MSVSMRRPDPRDVLADLKDFQLRTVRHVHHRLFLDDDKIDRFLVADEVGLGKTLVARGATALAIDHLWESTERIDIIYICSNVDIARQNINRLGIGGGAAYVRPTRLTLLPRAVHDLKDNKLNLVSLTPGTSFESHSAMGIAEERAILHEILRDAWGWGRQRWQRNLLCANATRKGFDGTVGWVRQGALDEELSAGFVAALDEEERTARARGESSLRQRFEELHDAFYNRQRQGVGDVEKEAQRHVIAELRKCLGESCVTALEPDFIILDEFQRFRQLLGEETEAGELAARLFSYDSHTEVPAKTLLLSATPYMPYSSSADADGAAGLGDFLATVQFLLPGEAEREQLHRRLTDFRSRLVRWSGEDDPELRADRRAIEDMLGQVMSRTERLAASADRNGMLCEVGTAGQELTTDDAVAYVSTQRVARALKHHDTLEYWKSAPYLLNLMEDYKFKRDAVAAIAVGGDTGLEVTASLKDAGGALLDRKLIERYREIDPANSRLRALAGDLWKAEAWRMLWLSPALPYYRPEGPFGTEAGAKLTKRLVFSSWAVVPKAISLILSYQAERAMTLSHQKRAKNTTRARENRGNLLRLSVKDGSPVGMPAVALMYPSFALAETVDPAEMRAGGSGRVASRDEVRAAVEALLEERVSAVIAIHQAHSDGPEDERWYWAVPMLLDLERDETVALSWLVNREVWDLTAGSSGYVSGAGWQAHLSEAASLMRGELERQLGPPPPDVVEVVALQALAAPGTSALRALHRMRGDGTLLDAEVRTAALRVGWSFRTLFNLPEVSSMIRGYGWVGAYWRQALRYCVDGCLQAVLDEYAHVLREHRGFIGGRLVREELDDIANAMHDVVGLRTTRGSVDYFDFGRSGLEIDRESMRARFALRFGEQRSDEGAEVTRADHVRDSFNSPFWPFVLASTSVGQEGLDFHLYCHRIVHWNLPSNPVDLEQREGRVHRYKGHAVRRNLAARHGEEVLRAGEQDPWSALFERGAADRPPGESELWPYWVYTLDGGDQAGEQGPGAQIERQAMGFALSRDAQRLADLKRALTLYRSVIGQPRQEDLLALLAEKIPAGRREEAVRELRIDLTPREWPPIELPDAAEYEVPPKAVPDQSVGDDEGGAEEDLDGR